jgi:hypothetical protein
MTGELQEQGRWFVYVWYQSGTLTARLMSLSSNADGDVSEIDGITRVISCILELMFRLNVYILYEKKRMF